MKTAIIIAGGKGERLRPYTEERPKAMIPVLGNPLLTFQLRLLFAHNFRKVIICCGHRHEVIQEFYGDGSSHGVQIDYLIENQPLGRGGALRAAMERICPSEPVLAMNGDILTNVDLTDLLAFHNAENAQITLVSVPYKSPFGIVELTPSSKVSKYEEKPELPFWINAGIYILSPSVLSELPKIGDHEVLTFPGLVEKGQLSAYQSNSFWRSIETVKDLTEVRNQLEELIFGTFLKVC